MKTPLPARRTPRRAFTLVELLAAIAIIAALSALVLAIIPGVRNAQQSATTRGFVSAMQSSLESFKNTYGAYPTDACAASDSLAWQQALHDGLTGLKVLKQVNGSLQLLNFDDSKAATNASKKPVRLSFITGSQIPEITTSGETIITDESKALFVDAWNNPFQYRYAPISGNKLSTAWESPGFLLVSAGRKSAAETPVDSDFFSGGMESSGKIPDNYFDDQYRADNITNWKIE